MGSTPSPDPQSPPTLQSAAPALGLPEIHVGAKEREESHPLADHQRAPEETVRVEAGAAHVQQEEGTGRADPAVEKRKRPRETVDDDDGRGTVRAKRRRATTAPDSPKAAVVERWL